MRQPTRAQALFLVAFTVLIAVIAVLSVWLVSMPAAVAPAASHVPVDAPSTVATPDSGLPRIAMADLPPQARDTLALIDAGGPFPYRQDGTVFANQEHRLPSRETGYYREYTVPTPGSDDRGARRLVVGRDGDVYYTADHYDTFRQLAR
jgi:ribonuclease T1